MAIEYGSGTFHWADYLVFAIVLGISTGVGVFFGFCEKKKPDNTEDFLMAGRNMSVLPVAVSLFVSIMSAIGFLGDPVEVYMFGAGYWWLCLGYSIGLPLIAHWIAPVYHRLRLTSAYEFLESRYNRGIRLLGSIVNAFTTILWMAIVLYAPSLAISQASGMSVWVSIITIGVVCTFYTTVGGMKAVVWADTIQMVIMVAGLLAVIIQGSIQVGGMDKVFEISRKGGRINMGVFNPNPYIRSSFWIYSIGGFARVFLPYVGTQFCIQRYCTLKTTRDVKIAVYLNIPFFLIMTTFLAALGLVMYASYHDCDPFISGRIERHDQMVPLLVLDLLGFMPGVPGLFMACVFSASLSTLSSGMNALSATFLKDMIWPWYEKKKGHPLDDKMATWIAKGIVIVTGLLVTIISFLIMALGSSVFEMTAKMSGLFYGPLIAAFLLAILYPKIRTMGMMIGFCISLFIMLWIGIGAIVHKPRYAFLPLSVANCPVPVTPMANMSDVTAATESTMMAFITTAGDMVNTGFTTVASTVKTVSSGVNLYAWNALYYAPLAILMAAGIGIAADYLLDRFGYYAYRSKDSPPSTDDTKDSTVEGKDKTDYKENLKTYMETHPPQYGVANGVPLKAGGSNRDSWFIRADKKLSEMSPNEWHSLTESTV